MLAGIGSGGEVGEYRKLVVCGIYRGLGQRGRGDCSWCSVAALGMTLMIGSGETVEEVHKQPAWSSGRHGQ